VGIVVMPLGILLSYYLLGHKNSFIPGLNLGAVGVAYKMMAIDILSVCILLFYNALFLRISFLKQLMSLLIISIIQYGVYFLIESIYRLSPYHLSLVSNYSKFKPVVEAFSKIGLFFAILSFLILFFPSLIGFSRETLTNHMKIKGVR